MSVPANGILYIAGEASDVMKPRSPTEFPDHISIGYSYKINLFPLDEHDELFRRCWMIITHSLCKEWYAYICTHRGYC